MDAAATGTGLHSRKSLSGSAPSSARITPSARLGAIGGTSAWRVPVATPSGIPLRNVGRRGLAGGPGDLALGDRLIVDAEASGRHGLEPGVTDGLPARGAQTVGAVVEPVERVLDVAQLTLDPLQNR